MSARSFRRAYARRVAAEQRRALRAGRTVAIAGAVAASAFIVPNAQAASTITVTNLTDTGAGSLRQAITDAANGDTIDFQAGLTGELDLGSELLVDKSVTITGPGASTLALSGQDATRVVHATATGVTISGLTLTHGLAAGAGGGAVLLDSTGSLTLSDDVISESSAEEGGGVDASSNVTITGSTISDNHATNGDAGGVLAKGNGSLALRDSVVSGNTASAAAGGVLSEVKYGALKISSSTISGNSAPTAGGVAIFGGNVIAKYGPNLIQDSTITGNQADVGAGVEIPVLLPGAAVTIQRTTISGNVGTGSTSNGAGLTVKYADAPLRVIDSTISGNTAATGAGVSLGYTDGPPLLGFCTCANVPRVGSISFENSTIAANTASVTGGGIFLGSYAGTAPGSYDAATVTLTSTVVGDNTAAGVPQDLDRADDASSGGFDAAFDLIEQLGDAPLTTNTANHVGVDAQLGPLANNGGFTQTQLPSGTSPVIDQGKAPVALTTDQTGAVRDVDSPLANAPGGDGTDIGAVEVPASRVVLPIPPLPPPPPEGATPDAGFRVTLGGAPFGGLADPLLAGSATPVQCDITLGALAACTLEVRAADAVTARAAGYTVTKGTLLASGEVVAGELTGQLRLRVNLSPEGKSLLRRVPVGVEAVTTATGRALGSPSITGFVHLMHGTLLTLTIGSRTKTLPPKLATQLDQLAKVLIGARTISCTAYSDRGTGDTAITTAQARAACARLVHDGVKGKVTSAGRGHIRPLLSNATSTGRVTNRRVVIRFAF